MPLSHQLVEEAEAESFARDLTSFMREHGLVDGAPTVYALRAFLRRGRWALTERSLRARLAQIMILFPVHLRQLKRKLEGWKRSQRFRT